MRMVTIQPDFAAQLKKTVFNIAAEPSNSMGHDLLVPSTLLTEMTRFVVEWGKADSRRSSILRYEINTESLATTIRQILFKVGKLGMTYEKDKATIEKAIKYSLEYKLSNYPCHTVWYPVRFGIPCPNDEISIIDEQVDLTSYSYPSPLHEIEYGIANSLFSWNGNKWRITPLGQFLMELSLPTAKVYLLLVEMYFGTSTANESDSFNQWHLSRAFLNSLLNQTSVSVDIGQETYTLSNLDPNMEYLNRLDSMGLLTTIDRTKERWADFEVEGRQVLHFGDDFFEINLTEHGRDVIESALQLGGEYLTLLVGNLVRFELSGTKYLNFNEASNPERLLTLCNQYSEITLDQKSVIESIVSTMKSGSDPVIILRALPPTIERILKNILCQVNLENRNEILELTLEPVCARFEKMVLSENSPVRHETIRFVRSLNRNDLLHGNISPSGTFGEMLVGLTLNVLLKLFEDYDDWKAGKK